MTTSNRRRPIVIAATTTAAIAGAAAVFMASGHDERLTADPTTAQLVTSNTAAPDAPWPYAGVDHYLGLDISPSEWVEIMASREAEITRCLSAKGYGRDAPSPIAAADDLRVTDPAAFAAKYGYGFALGVREDRDRSNATSTTIAGHAARRAAAVEACDAANDSDPIVSQHVAPVAMTNRYGELLAAFRASETYADLQAKWRACMGEAGYDADGLTSDATFELMADFATRFDSGDEPAHGEGNYQLSDDELDQLQAFELTVFAADQACQHERGLFDARLDSEATILATLKAEFPDYRPPAR
jgi:hypothetical protein